MARRAPALDSEDLAGNGVDTPGGNEVPAGNNRCPDRGGRGQRTLLSGSSAPGWRGRAVLSWGRHDDGVARAGLLIPTVVGAGVQPRSRETRVDRTRGVTGHIGRVNVRSSCLLKACPAQKTHLIMRLTFCVGLSPFTSPRVCVYVKYLSVKVQGVGGETPTSSHHQMMTLSKTTL